MVSLAIGLLSIRILWRTLGSDGYGVLTAINASGSMLNFFSTALLSSSQRHLSFVIGKGNEQQSRLTFNAVQLTYISLAVTFALVAILLKDFVLLQLSVPEKFRSQAPLIYLASIGTFGSTILLMPYRAAFRAHQEIPITAGIDSLSRVALFLAALSLPWFGSSAIVFYAYMTMFIAATFGLLTMMLATRKYDEVSIFPRTVPLSQITPVLSFAGWKFWDSLAFALREQGSVVLINSYFGAAANAAYAVGQQLTAHMVSLATAINSALAPAAATSEGEASVDRSLQISTIGSKYPFIISLCIGLPIFVYPSTLLEIITGLEPDETSIMFLRILLCIRLCGMLSWGDMLIADAKGKVARVALLNSIPFLIGFFAITMVWRQARWESPVILPWTMFAVTFIISIVAKPIAIGPLFGRDYGTFIQAVILPALTTILAGAVPCQVCKAIFGENYLSLLTASLTTSLAIVIAAWSIGTDAWERRYWRDLYHRISRKIYRSVSLG